VVAEFKMSTDKPLMPLEFPVGVHPLEWKLSLHFKTVETSYASSQSIAARCFLLQILNKPEGIP
jgi:hypothetical protein